MSEARSATDSETYTVFSCSAGGAQTRGGCDSAGEGLLCGQPHHLCHAQGHGHLHEEGGRRQPGSREHLRNDRGESRRPPRPSGFHSPRLILQHDLVSFSFHSAAA